MCVEPEGDPPGLRIPLADAGNGIPAQQLLSLQALLAAPVDSALVCGSSGLAICGRMRHAWAPRFGFTARVARLPVRPAQDAASDADQHRIEVQGQSAYRLAPHEGDGYVGTFAPETGSTLKIWQAQNRLYTQLDVQPQHP